MVPQDLGPAEVFRVLFVCTGNLCRSPLAERLGRAYVDDVLGDSAASVQLASAGTGAVGGDPMHPFSGIVLRGLGGNPAEFSARRLEAALVERADLVLTMTRGQRSAALGLAPRAMGRTFTLREAADLVRMVDVSVPDGEVPVARARSLVDQMAAVRTRRQGTAADDITDPIGRSIEIHQRVGETIADALLPLLERIAAVSKAPSAAEGDPSAPPGSRPRGSASVPPADDPVPHGLRSAEVRDQAGAAACGSLSGRLGRSWRGHAGLARWLLRGSDWV